MKKKGKQYLTPNEVAEMMMVSPVTVRQWASKGELPALTTPGGHRRFVKQDIEDFARQRGLALLPAARQETRILIVDDDQQLAGYLKELLSTCHESTKIEIAYDGFEAGQKVESFHPNIILLDLMMPGMNGYEVCRRIKTEPHTKPMRVIAMTGYPSEENVKKIIGEGAEICISKPIDTGNLLDLLGLSRKEQMRQSG